jgi:hypothetical protein
VRVCVCVCVCVCECVCVCVCVCVCTLRRRGRGDLFASIRGNPNGSRAGGVGLDDGCTFGSHHQLVF